MSSFLIRNYVSTYEVIFGEKIESRVLSMYSVKTVRKPPLVEIRQNFAYAILLPIGSTEYV